MSNKFQIDNNIYLYDVLEKSDYVVYINIKRHDRVIIAKMTGFEIIPSSSRINLYFKVDKYYDYKIIALKIKKLYNSLIEYELIINHIYEKDFINRRFIEEYKHSDKGNNLLLEISKVFL